MGHMFRNWRGWLALGTFGGLYWLGALQRSAKREPLLEAIESPEFSEAWTRISSMPQFKFLRGMIAARAVSQRQQARVLDVGSGAGQLSMLLAKRPEVRDVTGIDLSNEMVQIARHNAEMKGANAQFVQADVAEMPFADASFDVVVSTLSLHHWQDPVAGLREINRVLAPGGKALIFDLRRDAFPPVLGVAALVSQYVVPEPIRETGEPISSFQAALTPCEAILQAAKAGWDEPHVTEGLFWYVLEMDKIGER